MLRKSAIIAVFAFALAACQDQAASGSSSRNSIRAVGSSTVYPFATVVGERFAEAMAMKKPQIESTGTGGGFERFCTGIGSNTPDIANASRRMKKKEFDKCSANGVSEIVEIQIGIDGIAFGISSQASNLSLTDQDIYNALAANPSGKPNKSKTWKDINPELPAIAISVFGPPSTSGTYDAFKELILSKGCNANPAMQALKSSDKDRHKDLCETLRGVPFYVEQGENDNLIISKLDKNPGNLGIFGFNYLEANRDKISAVSINGIAPSYDAIADGSYSGSRPLFLYIKKAHVDIIPGIAEYVAEFLSAAGKNGYLADKGLVTSPPNIADNAAHNAKNMTVLQADQLQ